MLAMRQPEVMMNMDATMYLKSEAPNFDFYYVTNLVIICYKTWKARPS